MDDPRVVDIRNFQKLATLEDWLRIEKFNYTLSQHGVLINEAQYSIIYRANTLPGPKILKVEGAGYGLFADKDYEKGELKIEYGGEYVKNGTGDYVFEDYDSEFVFKYSEKGRWINDDYTKENVAARREKSGSIVFYNTKNIKKGEELIAYYGPYYNRPWLVPKAIEFMKEHNVGKERLTCILHEMGFGISPTKLYDALLLRIANNIGTPVINKKDLDTMPRVVSSKFWKRFWNTEKCINCKMDTFIVENNFCGTRCQRLFNKK